MTLTAEQLRRIMPHLRAAKRRRMLPLLQVAMQEFGIDNPARAAAFLAQIAHESGELRHLEELADGSAYEGRADLGNTQPGDGPRYKGRGAIMLTGRANYRSYGQKLGIDLEGSPRQAAEPPLAFRIAGAFWKEHGLNQLADQGDFIAITRRINGGLNGLASRQTYHEKAKATLGAPDVLTGHLEYPNGSVYDGPLRDGRPHGDGRIKYGDGDRYVGSFENGVRSGQGRYEYKSGAWYEGPFAHGVPNGLGRYGFASGSLYEGEYKDGKRSGHGVWSFPADGQRFEGEFADDRPAQGTMFYPSGDRYEGVVFQRRAQRRGRVLLGLGRELSRHLQGRQGPRRGQLHDRKRRRLHRQLRRRGEARARLLDVQERRSFRRRARQGQRHSRHLYLGQRPTLPGRLRQRRAEWPGHLLFSGWKPLRGPVGGRQGAGPGPLRVGRRLERLGQLGERPPQGRGRFFGPARPRARRALEGDGFKGVSGGDNEMAGYVIERDKDGNVISEHAIPGIEITVQ